MKAAVYCPFNSLFSNSADYLSLMKDRETISCLLRCESYKDYFTYTSWDFICTSGEYLLPVGGLGCPSLKL